MKFSQAQLFKAHYLKALIFICIIISVFGMYFPILRNDDPTLYASIAKNIVFSHNWANLMHPVGVDWLDKPHLPFWLTAISFKIFGITSFAYILPGFLFNLLGGYYTYRLARVLYNKNIGLIAALIYFSAFHLLLSATVDIRAEAYLMGMITPACYYWYRYYKKSLVNFKWLLCATLFTASAIMTKGLFTLITIGSGVFAVSIFSLFNNPQENKTKHNTVTACVLKYGLAIILTLIFITPELFALYLQFDMHPEKVIFGTSHVSGLKWFFWDSQFGRFFNSGPISRHEVMPWHYLYFVHTFMWVFLPWSVLFIVALWHMFRHELKQSPTIFITASFFITFILFSLSRFQLDYYLNILMPFAAIICARWIYFMRLNFAGQSHPVFRFQIGLAILLNGIVLALSFFVFSGLALYFCLMMCIGGLLLFLLFMHHDLLTKAILYPIISINIVFVFALLIYGYIYAKYDAGYNIAQYFNNKAHAQVVDFRVNSLTLEFYTKDNYTQIHDLSNLKQLQKPYYIVAFKSDKPLLMNNNIKLVEITTFVGTTIDKVMANLLKINNLNKILTDYVILEVK